ncbi:MAG: FKBP-type peptidyl-prolyl cis-trans isomerase [Paludibacter sp.]
MKRTALFSLFILLLTIILPACKEDVYMDWKIQNEKALADTIKKYKNSANFYTTASGLSYRVIHQGYFPKKPNSGSYIYATYTGKLIDGSTFDSGTNAYLGQVATLVPGFQEAVKKMNSDANYIFYIPSTLGYDTVSTNSSIPAHSALIFDVTLTSVY